MKFIAKIDIMPLKQIYDAEGKIVEDALHELGYPEVSHVRIGKRVTLEIVAKTKEEAMIKVNELCGKLLHSKASEGFEYKLEEV